MTTPYIRLNDGNRIPVVGLGVFLSPVGDVTRHAVAYALTHGYTHIDTAAVYGNEADVGAGIIDAGVKREDIFITTKLWTDDVRAGKTREALMTSLEKLKLDYVDLYLIHWPADGFEKAYLEMLKLKEEGLIKSVGVSNFHKQHLDKLRQVTNIMPAVNQVESHPYLSQIDLFDECRRYLITPEAWAPLGGEKSQGELLNHPLIKSIAQKHGKTPAQILIAWQAQRGAVVIPKSVKPQRIDENINVFDFKFDDRDLIAMQDMNIGRRFGTSPDNFSF